MGGGGSALGIVKQQVKERTLGHIPTSTSFVGARDAGLSSARADLNLFNYGATPEQLPPGETASAAPTPENPETQTKLDEAAAEQRKARGRASTILTGGSGVSGRAQTARRTLLGS
jgi:hypothetical protein